MAKYLSDFLNSTYLVIPFFNEERRLSADQLLSFIEDTPIQLVLVDDGSSDRSAEIGEEIQATRSDIHLVRLPKNQGKATALFTGMKWALDRGATFVGYTDVDLPVPSSEFFGLLDILRKDDALKVVSGARVRLAGSSVSRPPLRLWAGRIIATAVALQIGCQFYDPQSPCKWFRSSSELRVALATAPHTRWFGDAVIIRRMFRSLRLNNSPFHILEVPLKSWSDIDGGHLSLWSLPKLLVDVLRVRKSSQ